MWSDGFESNNFTSGGWMNSGASITSSQRYSGTYSTKLVDSNSITKSYSTSDLTDIKVQYARYLDDWTSLWGVFYAEWSVDGGTWYSLETDDDGSAWAAKSFSLPSGANNQPGFRIRFRVSSFNLGQCAYVDDVKIIGL